MSTNQIDLAATSANHKPHLINIILRFRFEAPYYQISQKLSHKPIDSRDDLVTIQAIYNFYKIAKTQFHNILRFRFKSWSCVILEYLNCFPLL